ncbi:MAG: YggS family pyridoxal phosphate-dependent enzyme [Candidatus Tectomicrobia bacterium]|uniref:Pyridoxal phosphate homeostasis protein n=1 Tax=Tectimicrobiota bacterium TaxID=2528274 RepID=A0A932GMM4_UNCTE|nr:YggS family pyridoxal phosphate-dependent enzyme [Candidatus Tectomicrobia bacterium]
MVDQSLQESLARVRERIERAARTSGRRPEKIKLVAVTKTFPVEVIREAVELGVTCFGENRVQEAREKIPAIGRGVEWHLIGTLQRNKVKYIFDLFDMVQSLDSFALGQEIEDRGRARGRVMPVLVEVNVSGEASKSGVRPEELPELLRRLSDFRHLAVKGLMAIPPLTPNPEEARPYFRELRRLRDQVASEGIRGIELEELSMGMSADFEVAIAEGASMVRIGTAIFGARNPKAERN